jgi:hypothetical protein
MKRTRKVLKAQVEPKIPERLPDAVCGSPSVDFAQISTHMLRNPNLSCKAKGLLCMLLSNRKGHWTSFSKGLEKLCSDGPDALRTGLKELEEAGYLLRINYVDIKTKRRRGSFWVYTHFSGYFQFEEHLQQLKRIGCEPQGGQTLLDYPDLENPIMDNPNLGYPRQIILINNNTKDNKNKESTHPNKKITPDQFEEFWKLYPRKVGKPTAKQRWVALSKKPSKDQPDFDTIKKAIQEQSKSDQWQDPKYIPHPSTWINGERWEDELPGPSKPTPKPHPNKLGHRSGAKFKVNAKVERMEQ